MSTISLQKATLNLLEALNYDDRLPLDDNAVTLEQPVHVNGKHRIYAISVYVKEKPARSRDSGDKA